MRSLDLLLITNPHGPLVLLLAGPGGWGLPHNAPPQAHWWQVTTPVNQAAAHFGLVTTTMRCLRIVDDEQANEARCYYGLELRGEPGPTLEGQRWVSRADLADLKLASAEQREILDGWLSGPPSRVPQAFVRAAYLGPWERFAPRAELERLFDLALLLAPMHHALIYHRSILPAMEHGWEMERMLPYYLRLILSALSAS